MMVWKMKVPQRIRIRAWSSYTWPSINARGLPVITKGNVATSLIEKLALNGSVDDIAKITQVVTSEPDPVNLDQCVRLITRASNGTADSRLPLFCEDPYLPR